MSYSSCIDIWSFIVSSVFVIPFFSVCLSPQSLSMESFVLNGTFARQLGLEHAGEGKDWPRPGFYGPHAKNSLYIFKG